MRQTFSHGEKEIYSASIWHSQMTKKIVVLGMGYL
jgi:hypothetical protein